MPLSIRWYLYSGGDDRDGRGYSKPHAMKWQKFKNHTATHTTYT
jgi:hypothetical protein